MDKTVVCYIECNNKWLMMLRNKKKNDLNEGKWIGVGGHVEEGETYDEALVREVREETAINLDNFKECGEVFFYSGDYSEYMKVYTAKVDKEEFGYCDEGTLEFIEKSKVKSLNLWQGDLLFLDFLLNNDRYFSLNLYYDGDNLVNWSSNN